jgi:hypothetical protein
MIITTPLSEVLLCQLTKYRAVEKPSWYHEVNHDGSGELSLFFV